MNRAESKYFRTAVKMDEALLTLLEQKDFAYITIKEICALAGVNRSTFYLHYEHMGDLLTETLAYMHEKFNSYFDSNDAETAKKLEDGALETLVFVTEENLVPYLNFIMEHKRLFVAVMKHPEVFASQQTFDRLSKMVFYPVLEQFAVPKDEREYMLSFYIKGIMGVIEQWLRDDCKDPVEFVSGLVIKLVLSEERLSRGNVRETLEKNEKNRGETDGKTCR